MPIDAGVLVKALILGGDEGILNDLRNLVYLDEGPALETELRDEAPIDCVQLRRLVRRVLSENFDRRTLVAAADQCPAGVDSANAGCDQKRERKQRHSDERGMPLAKGKFAVRDCAGRRSGGRGHANVKR